MVRFEYKIFGKHQFKHSVIEDVILDKVEKRPQSSSTVKSRMMHPRMAPLKNGQLGVTPWIRLTPLSTNRQPVAQWRQKDLKTNMTEDDTTTTNPQPTPAGSAASASAEQPGFQFKGGLVPLTQLELFEYDYRAFNQRLSKMVKQAPSFFRDMPVIINLERLHAEHDAIDFIELTEVCQAYGVYPIAIRGGSEDQLTAAFVAGLPQIPANPTHKAFHQRLMENQSIAKVDLPAAHAAAAEKSAQQTPTAQPAQTTQDQTPAADEPATESSNPEPAAPQREPAKIIRHAIRSGQQIYAPRGDLIVIGSVSAGAEILADGNIHVYGTLRGRALAGVKGDTEARIFCQKLEAELLSIAGHYKMDEDLQRAHWQKSIQATLDGKRLKIDAL